MVVRLLRRRAGRSAQREAALANERPVFVSRAQREAVKEELEAEKAAVPAAARDMTIYISTMDDSKPPSGSSARSSSRTASRASAMRIAKSAGLNGQP